MLDRDPRLRASIVVPMQNTETAVEEIERWAPDHRFVQVLVSGHGRQAAGAAGVLAGIDAAQRHGLPIGIHAGVDYQQSDHADRLAVVIRRGLLKQAQGFQTQVASLVYEGVFQQFPALQRGAD